MSGGGDIFVWPDISSLVVKGVGTEGCVRGGCGVSR